jgi:hypothetical protein
MKKILVGLAFFTCVTTIMNKADAQVRFNVRFNIGSQPVWGPVGYDRVEYYYLPDIETYYYVPRHQFIYLSGDRWVFSSNLPPRYRDYDLYSGYKVVMNEPRPYMHFERDRDKYSRYRGDHSQQIIARSDDRKYRGRGWKDRRHRYDNGRYDRH